MAIDTGRLLQMHGIALLNVEGLGGAQSTGGTAANAINGIAPKNPNLRKYLNAAAEAFDD